MEDNAHLSLAKRLAHSSDKSIRDDAFRVLASWLEGNTSTDEEEYMKVWKALFYSMWHSDKIPVQQELAFHIARLTRRLYNPNSSKFEALDERVFCFLRAFWRTMQREWMGIDHLRLDKFMSLTRRMIHEGFVFVAKKGFAEAVSKRLCKDVLSLALADRPNGIRFHTIDCWVDEIATAAGATITTPQLQLLMAPIYEHCIDTDEKILFERIVKEILRPLAERTVEVQAPAEEDDESAAGAGGKDGKKSFETPLLMDAHARQEALASAFKKVDLCLLAKDVFAIAALGVTRIGARSPLYALHKEIAAHAIKLKQAKTEDDCLPKPVGVPTSAVSFALELASKRLGKKLSAAAAAAASFAGSADSGAAVSGQKRSREQMEKSAAKKEDGGKKKKAKKAARDEEDEDDIEVLEGDDEDDDEAPPAAAPSAKGKKGKAAPVTLAAPTPAPTPAVHKKSKSKSKEGGEGERVEVDDDAMAVLAAIPTVGQLSGGKLSDAKEKKGKEAEKPAEKAKKGDAKKSEPEAKPAVKPAAPEPEAKAAVKGILKKTAPVAAAPAASKAPSKKASKK